MGLIVQKFGGTSVADLKRIQDVAERIIKIYDKGNNVVVIVSAMAGVTDDLIDMAQEITDAPAKRELDVLLATGEQTTASLLAMTLTAMNYPAQLSPSSAISEAEKPSLYRDWPGVLVFRTAII